MGGIKLSERNIEMKLLLDIYNTGKITQREYAEAKMAQGYSVSGFCDLGFGNMLLENPDWETEDDNQYSAYTDGYLRSNMKSGKYSLTEVLKIISLRDNITAEESEEYFIDEFI